MAMTFRIKRRAAGGAAGAPSSLAAAELAYNEQDDVLYYGKGNSGGNATSIVAIGGPGAFGSTPPGGSNTQVQYNDSGAFGGDAAFTFNKTTDVLTLTGQLVVNLGNANSIIAAGVVEGSSFRCAGTIAALGPASAGNVALRPNGIASATGQLLITTTGVTANNPITLPADPTSALHAATKQYVDATKTASIQFVIDGGGSAITTGIKGYIEVPFACTITAARMFADATGSIVVDIFKDTYANYPPVVADKITASAPPTISATNKSQDTTLTGWNKAIAAGDILGFNVNSAATIQRVTVSLTVTKT